jgi:hypothetical protein
LSGPGLLTFLSQIRNGFNNRYKPGNKFPRSLALVGMHNINGYITKNNPDEESSHLAGYYNIFSESLTLDNLTTLK